MISLPLNLSKNQTAGAILRLSLVFVASFTISLIIQKVTNVALITQIKPEIFSFFISWVITAVILLLDRAEFMLNIKLSLTFFSKSVQTKNQVVLTLNKGNQSLTT